MTRLHRLRHGLEPTQAAPALLRHARLILRSISDMDAELGDVQAGHRGQVRLWAIGAALEETAPERGSRAESWPSRDSQGLASGLRWCSILSIMQMPPLPLATPVFDHVVVNARDRLDEAQAAYERLGFTLTPRGFHSLGSANHLAIFGTDYLELIAVAGQNSARQDILADPHGLNGLVFATEDSAITYAGLVDRGVPATPPNEFVRPVALPDGERDARFRTVHVQPTTGRPGRLYFCHHFTRDLVWRDEWRQHANGTIGVQRAVIASDDPAILRDLFGRMFGAAALTTVPGGVSLLTGLGRIDVLRHDAVAALLGTAAGEAGGRAHYMAALTLRTRSLDLVRAALAGGGVTAQDLAGRILVPASAAMGCPIEFVA